MVTVSHFETLKLVNDAQIGHDNTLIQIQMQIIHPYSLCQYNGIQM